MALGAVVGPVVGRVLGPVVGHMAFWVVGCVAGTGSIVSRLLATSARHVLGVKPQIPQWFMPARPAAKSPRQI
jgi:hypothetical protein